MEQAAERQEHRVITYYDGTPVRDGDRVHRRWWRFGREVDGIGTVRLSETSASIEIDGATLIVFRQFEEGVTLAR